MEPHKMQMGRPRCGQEGQDKDGQAKTRAGRPRHGWTGQDTGGQARKRADRPRCGRAGWARPSGHAAWLDVATMGMDVRPC
ncbi:hypothetical protein R1flu_019065 [Riccia fluitans]|uniref:Uncharacterized protein n=1 Tax=Riccia fluitans TaxID=41844 RepID=A0ABD1ZHV8_9MARC